jgi:hypothetical protein
MASLRSRIRPHLALLLAALWLAGCVASAPQPPRLYEAVSGWRPIGASESWVVLPSGLDDSVIARLGRQEGPRLSQRLVFANNTVLEGENYLEVMMSGDPADRRRPFTEEAFLGAVASALPGGSTSTGQTSNPHGMVLYALAENADGTRCLYAVQRLLSDENGALPASVEIATLEYRHCTEAQGRAALLAQVEQISFNPLLTVTGTGYTMPAF